MNGYIIKGVSEYHFTTHHEEFVLDCVQEENINIKTNCRSLATITSEIKHATLPDGFMEAYKKGDLKDAECRINIIGYDMNTGLKKDIDLFDVMTVENISIYCESEEIASIRISITNKRED